VRPNGPSGHVALVVMSRFRLTVIALTSAIAAAVLGLAVSRGFSARALEHHVIRLLGHPPDVDRWADLADFLAVPVIGSVFLVSVVYGALRHLLLRVGVLAGFAAVALLISEHIAKPAVHQLFGGALSFPSGNVTAVCATALAMWLALCPAFGMVTRVVTFAFGAAWTILMSLAVVGAYWHTPLDCIGSVLLSVGIVTTGAALLAPRPSPTRLADPEPARVMGRV
jgi:membrane-associated phospholipid phosphatase